MKAMILAAGLGTRLRPITYSTPKALVKVGEQTLLETIIKRLKLFGFNQIIINVHHFADQIIQFIDNKNSFDIHIEISREDNLLDTGGGLKKAAWFFDDDKPFLLHNVDILSDVDIAELTQFHKKNNSMATLATRKRKTTRYLLVDTENNFCGWKSIQSGQEKIVGRHERKLSPISFMGIHIISPKLLKLLPPENKFSIIETYVQLAENYSIKTMRCDKCRWLDLGKPEKLKQAEIVFPDFF